MGCDFASVEPIPMI